MSRPWMASESATKLPNAHANSKRRIVASLVRAQPLAFFFNIVRWLLVAIPATGCNSLLSYIQSELALAYRTRLTNEVLGQYLGNEEDQDKIFYKICVWTRPVDFETRVLTYIMQRIWTIAYRMQISE